MGTHLRMGPGRVYSTCLPSIVCRPVDLSQLSGPQPEKQSLQFSLFELTFFPLASRPLVGQFFVCLPSLFPLFRFESFQAQISVPPPRSIVWSAKDDPGQGAYVIRGL